MGVRVDVFFVVCFQVSVSLIGGGWLYCSKRMEYTSVKCDISHCDVEELSSGVTKVLTIPVRRCGGGVGALLDDAITMPAIGFLIRLSAHAPPPLCVDRQAGC